jgi:hypothetical protein
MPILLEFCTPLHSRRVGELAISPLDITALFDAFRLLHTSGLTLKNALLCKKYFVVLRILAGMGLGSMAKHPSGRGPARFKEREVARAVRAARSAGGVARVEIAEDGRITLVLTTTDGEQIQADSNEWDEALNRGKR